MDQTPDSTGTPLEPERPSWMSRFFRGFVTGAGSGALMMGIYNVVLVGAALTGFGGGWAALEFTHILAVAAMGIMTTGLFGGVMAATKQAPEEQQKAIIADQVEKNGVVVPTLAYGLQPALDTADDNAITADDADQTVEDAARRNKNWAASVNRNANRRSLHQIIADGKMSDKDRASAILAEREAAASEDKTASMA